MAPAVQLDPVYRGAVRQSSNAASGDAVRLPRLNKSQSAPQLKRGQPEPAQLSRAKVAADTADRVAEPAGIHLTFEAKRKVLEALANPNIRKAAEDLYNRHNAEANSVFGLQELKAALRALTKKLHMPQISSNMAESMLKKFDVNGDGKLTANDFYELFVASLRRVAFDQSSLMGRSVFVSRQPGKVWDTYRHLKAIGKGSFATSYLVQHRYTGDERVVKAVEKSRMKLPIEDIEREILVLSQIDHPHIVRFYEWYEGSNTVYMVIDALKGGTLREHVLESSEKGTGLREDWIREVILQVVESLAYCHSLRLIHKDIKDENIMLLKRSEKNDKPYAVIIDLGVAEMFAVSEPQGNFIAGTPATMAPEVWTGNFGPKCDVWSTGCVLFELLAGCMPFTAVTLRPRDWAKKLKAGPDWRSIGTSEQGKDLCQKMLTYSEIQRPYMAQCLQHPWFSASSSTLQQAVRPVKYNDLKKFCDISTLSRSLLLEIACRLPMHKAERIVEVFQSFDENRDGKISKDELVTGFAKFGIKDTGILESTFKALDVDHNGTLSFSEFAAGVLLMFKELLESRFRLLFRRHNKAGDGVMTKEDVEKFLSVSRKIAKKDAQDNHRDIINELFAGGKTTVSYEELRRAVLPGYK